jgi:hypothetical protein
MKTKKKLFVSNYTASNSNYTVNVNQFDRIVDSTSVDSTSFDVLSEDSNFPPNIPPEVIDLVTKIKKNLLTMKFAMEQMPVQNVLAAKDVLSKILKGFLGIENFFHKDCFDKNLYEYYIKALEYFEFAISSFVNENLSNKL